MSRRFPGLTSASDGVVNLSAGGHLRPLQNRDLRLHVGIGSNHSPAAEGDKAFNEVDLLTWTFGGSGSGAEALRPITLSPSCGMIRCVPMTTQATRPI